MRPRQLAFLHRVGARPIGVRIGAGALTALLGLAVAGCTGVPWPLGTEASSPEQPAASAGNHEPPPSLELNPSASAKPMATPADGRPVGSSTSVYPDGRIDPGLQPLIDTATADLASRLGVGAGEIHAISAVLVTWRDSSLGCPQPGMEYLQVLQDGSIIELGWGDRVYRYHTGGTRGPFLCDQPLSEPPADGSG